MQLWANKGDVCEQDASTEWGLIRVEERELPAIWTLIMDLKQPSRGTISIRPLLKISIRAFWGKIIFSPADLRFISCFYEEILISDKNIWKILISMSIRTFLKILISI